MADEALAKAGLYFDELHKVRLIKPQVYDNASDLKGESVGFASSLKQFEAVAVALIEALDGLSQRVESEKLKAIGSRNAVKTVVKQQEIERRQIQTVISEKQIELERLRIEHETLLAEERDQKEDLRQFLAPS